MHVPPSNDAEETPKQRAEREYAELLEEIRVALPGAEVILGFLLTAPFTEGFSRLSTTQKGIYFAALLCVAAATGLLLSPTAFHRLRYEAGDKPWITRRGTTLVIAAMAVMIPGLTGALFVVTDMLFSRAVAVAVACAAALFLIVLWFAVPLSRRR